MKKALIAVVLALVLVIGLALVKKVYEQPGDRPEVSAIGTASEPVRPSLEPQTDNAEPSRDHAETTQRRNVRPAVAAQTDSILVRNYEELWAQLDPGEQATVSAFSARYSDALRFYNNGQLLWMHRHGYPMPEDILAADQLEDEALTELAESGDARALAMQVDRLISRSAALGRDLLAQGIDPFADKDFFLVTLDLMQGLRSLYQSGTPFAGYMDARAQLEVYGIKAPESEFGNIVEIALQGLAYAVGRGDHLARNRALWLADEAGVNPEIFENYISYDSFYSSQWPTMCEPGNRVPDAMPYGVDP